MRRWVVILCIAIALIVGGIFETRYTQSSLKWLINSLESLQIELAENKDKIDTEELIEKSDMKVKIEMSPYDLTKGRITWRGKN